jgi:heterodisulfide reductase subunit A-like polyferredoxin
MMTPIIPKKREPVRLGFYLCHGGTKVANALEVERLINAAGPTEGELVLRLEPHPEAERLRRMFNRSCSAEGWFLERHPKLAPVNTFTDGIFLAGCGQGPKDIRGRGNLQRNRGPARPRLDRVEHRQNRNRE